MGRGPGWGALPAPGAAGQSGPGHTAPGSATATRSPWAPALRHPQDTPPAPPKFRLGETEAVTESRPRIGPGCPGARPSPGLFGIVPRRPRSSRAQIWDPGGTNSAWCRRLGPEGAARGHRGGGGAWGGRESPEMQPWLRPHVEAVHHSSRGGASGVGGAHGAEGLCPPWEPTWEHACHMHTWGLGCACDGHGHPCLTSSTDGPWSRVQHTCAHTGTRTPPHLPSHTQHSPSRRVGTHGPRPAIAHACEHTPLPHARMHGCAKEHECGVPTALGA